MRVALLIVLLIFALGFAVFAAQNTAPVALRFISNSTPPIPLFFILGVTLLLGIVLSWILTAFHRFSVARKLKGKEKRIQTADETIAELTKEVHKLELDNARLKKDAGEDDDTSL